MVMNIVLDFTNINSFMSVMFTNTARLITSSVFFIYMDISVYVCKYICVCGVFVIYAKLSVYKWEETQSISFESFSQKMTSF